MQSKTVSKNIFWLSLSRVAALLLLFFAYRYLYRYFGPFKTGQYQYVLSYVTIFGIVIDFGLQQYIIKKMSEEPEQIKRYFYNFLAVELVLVVCIYGALLAVAAAMGVEKIVWNAIAVAGIGLMVNGLTYPFLSVMSAYLDLRKVAAINLLNSFVNAAMIFSTIYFEKSIVFLAANTFIFSIFSLLLYNWFVQKYVDRLSVKKLFQAIDKSLLKTFFIAAAPFALLVGFSTIYNRIDVVLISRILGYEQAGLYTAAYKFFDLLNFFPAAVSHSLYPYVTGILKEGNLLLLRQVMEKYLRLLLAIALPLGVGAMFFADQIIHIIAGPEFAPAAPVLQVLAWAPAVLILYIIANTIVISHLTKWAVLITAANVIINILGNLYLLPRYGIIVAAVLTVCAELIQAIGYFYFIRKKITQFSFWKYFWRPALASVIMLILLWLIPVKLIFFAAPVAGAAYMALLALFGYFSRNDWQLLMELLGRKPDPDARPTM